MPADPFGRLSGSETRLLRPQRQPAGFSAAEGDSVRPGHQEPGRQPGSAGCLAPAPLPPLPSPAPLSRPPAGMRRTGRSTTCVPRRRRQPRAEVPGRGRPASGPGVAPLTQPRRSSAPQPHNQARRAVAPPREFGVGGPLTPLGRAPRHGLRLRCEACHPTEC